MGKKQVTITFSLGVCYGLMSFFINILHNVFLLYHVDMFVSVYKIDKMSFWIGETVFLVWNSLNDPLFGWISDRKYLASTGEKGRATSEIVLKRLSSIQWNGPFFSLAFITFWISWNMPSLQFVVCLCVYDGFLTAIELHHQSLLADLAVSAESRTKLNSRCSLFSAFGSASVFLSYAIWDKNNLDSFRMFCVILSILSFFGFYFSASILKKAYKHNAKELEEFVPSLEPQVEIQDKKMLRSYAKQLLSHKNFLWFALMNLIQVFHCHFNSNFFPLFLENLLGGSVGHTFGSFLIGISFVAPHINNLYFLSLVRRYGVYAVIKLLFSVKLFISIIMFAVGPNYIWMLCLFIASNRVFTEGTCKLLTLVISDLVDEDYVLHSRKEAVSALMFGTAALVAKPGQTFAPLIGTWLLSQQTGHDIFQSGNELGSIKLDASQMDEIQRQGCFNLLVYIPIACACLQLLVWSQFTLHGQRLRWVKSVRAGSTHSAV